MTWNLFDTDNDGTKTLIEIFQLLRIAIYLFAGLWSVIHVSEFSDVQFIAVIAASFGSSVFEMFLKAKIKGDESKKEVGKPANMVGGDSIHSLDERL